MPVAQRGHTTREP
jgi:hypothetical protein